MGWTKGKPRGSQCRMCKRYFKPHGLGPHMASHKAVKAVESGRTDLGHHMVKLLQRAADLRRKAELIEQAVATLKELGKIKLPAI